jgi:hypothetical protein
MPGIEGFTGYGGLAPHSGSIAQILDLQGVIAPHDGKAYRESLLYGISGGAVFAYFYFAYENQDPQVNLLTRNTFGEYGWDIICERLGISRDVIKSTSAGKAEAKLIELLEEGRAPAVWADVFTLGYEYSDLGEDMWAMQPVVVGEYPDPGSADGGEVLFADRSQAVHRCRAEIFQEARGRIQKDRYQMITLEAPDPGRLPEAVRAGIQDAVLLFFEKPPKGSGNNFGYKALTRLSADVASIKGKSAWDKLMPDPRMRLAGRMSALNYGHYFWKDGSADADRGLFADFLDQAAVILENDGIRSVAGQYRNIAAKWQSLAELWLPRELPLCADAADSIDGRHRSFRESGAGAVTELAAFDTRRRRALERAASGELNLERLKDSAAAISALLLEIRDGEADALRELEALVC